MADPNQVHMMDIILNIGGTRAGRARGENGFLLSCDGIHVGVGRCALLCIIISNVAYQHICVSSRL